MKVFKAKVKRRRLTIETHKDEYSCDCYQHHAHWFSQEPS
jgi:hypothetical protein